MRLRVPWWTVIAWVLVAAGVAGLLLPWLRAPITTDSQYHYVAAPGRFDNNEFNVLPWTIEDMGWRLRQGRIAPVGVFVQHVLYLAGIQLAKATGISLRDAEAVVKLFMLAVLFGALAWLLRSLRWDDGSPLARRARWATLTLASAGIAAGATTVSPHRNGWTAFPVLCIGSVVLMLLAGALTLRVADRWPTASRWLRGVLFAALALTGVAIVFAYEMAWAAYPFALALALPLWSRASAAIRRARWWAVAALSAGFIPAWIANRVLISTYAVPGAYAGLEFQPSLELPALVGRQILNAAPGLGWAASVEAAGKAGVSGPSLAVSSTVFGVVFAIGVLLLTLALGSGRARGGPLTGEERAAGASASPPGLHPLRRLALAAAVSALVAATIMSVSADAPNIVVTWGDTYRATPWIWVCVVICVVALLVSLNRFVIAGGLVALAGLASGVLAAPIGTADVRVLNHSVGYTLMREVHEHVLAGTLDPAANARRCRLVAELRVWAGDSDYRHNYIDYPDSAFRYYYGKPFCRN